MVPEILYQIQTELMSCNLVLNNPHADGRYNSIVHESQIQEEIRKKWGKDTILFPEDCGCDRKNGKNRCWWDFWLMKENQPGNFKTTTMKAPDNAANFLAVLWAFSPFAIAIDRMAQSGKDGVELAEFIVNSPMEENNRDYWFMVINKNNTQEIIVNSMKGLSVVRSNASNLPFQINWSLNKVYTPKTITEAWGIIKKAIQAGLCKDWKPKLYEAIQRTM